MRRQHVALVVCAFITSFSFADAAQAVEVRRGGDTDPLEQYVWDIRYIDAPVLRWRDDNDDTDFSDAGETLYYSNDANMNVTALVSASSGSVVERYVYSPYGSVTIYDDDWSDTVTWANSRKNEILFCGYRWDPESGMYHVRHRYYHPALGRWAGRDPLGYSASENLSEYAHGGPGVFVDPLGLEGRKVDWSKLYSQQVTETDADGTKTTRIEVMECNVVLAIGHSPTVRTKAFGGVQDMAAVGYLTCWADVYNRYPPVDTYAVTDWDSNGPIGRFDEPREGAIAGFPRIRGPVGWGPPQKTYRPLSYFSAGTVQQYGLVDSSAASNWNGPVGATGDAAWDSLYKMALDAAKRQAEELAKDCKCKCDYIDVWVIDFGGNTDFTKGRTDRGVVQSYPCEKKSKSGKDKSQLEQGEKAHRADLNRKAGTDPWARPWDFSNTGNPRSN